MHEPPLWQPTPTAAARSAMTAFAHAVSARTGKAIDNYANLYQWSLDEPAAFWSAMWDFCGIIGDRGDEVVIDGERMPGARWFPRARLNFAQNLLRRRDAGDAIVFCGEDGARRRLSYQELHVAVAQCASMLRAAGVRSGDRVAAYLPNLPETVIAMLAAASIGAIFSSSSPDFGAQGVLDRFGQIAPKILIAADGYYYQGKAFDGMVKLRDIASALPTVERVIVVPYLSTHPDLAGIPHAQTYGEAMAPHAEETEILFAPLPFDHPLYLLYSSGTTGVPKCIVHGAGGLLLQHLKEHRLHCDIRRDDRVFYFTTCGWMMWNWLASALASDATIVLYDGSSLFKRGVALFDLAQSERITHFGTSAKFLDAVAKAGLAPGKTHALGDLRMVLSTGSPLVPERFDYVYENIKRDVCLASISGGTDICSCFVLGNPTLPVRRGEIQCRGLGMKVEVFDEDGRALRGAKGELVCTAPFPAMPLGFWNDNDGRRYRAAYFEKYPGVWRHGDFAELTASGGVIIHGRADATLNPGGVRVGTAEIYRQVEKLDEVMESLAIAQEWPPGKTGDVRIVLFVRLREGRALDADLVGRIKAVIRDNCTPHHVPGKILQVADLPRTKSGKLVELAVRDVVHGRSVQQREALANPEVLEYLRDRAELKS